MAITQVNLSHFRNIKEASLKPDLGVNLLLGNNGSGKTSILEAIHFLGLGRSFRSHLTKRIVQHEQDAFTLFARFQHHDQTLPLGLRKSRTGDTELKINGQRADKLAQLAELLPLQLIHPEGYSLLTGGPKGRRSFIDWGVFHVEPSFFPQWLRVKRLLKQRNAALKTARSYRDIGFWDNELGERALHITQLRRDYLKRLEIEILNTAKDFLPEFEFSIEFFQGWDKSRDLLEYMQQNFERDRALGYTSIGPQKADLRVKVDGVPVADVLSRGQLKLLVCALRLAQGKFQNGVGSTKCIFLIDDFASELDREKRIPLAKHIAESGAQVFITAIEKEQIEELFGQQIKVFHVEHGNVSEQ
ncbi:DNA replication/repair protein RecF [Motilimonas sp. E26]|uniref:DNA replication/repair protein RecF n=1 Tax=Motilimonas sp. E26 TaxID=2865674 RepID=UPI001E498B03|nr:DNA replication/repair protein RecF [Motilimonas sp. E26]MCE0557766.1 DNA replication/repair protein RecF [Motilimonas sp. E26]